MDAPLGNAATERLEQRLAEPEPGERGYDAWLARHADDPVARAGRIDAVRELAARFPDPAPYRGTNTHLHTNKSFGIFASPSQAAWQAHREGVEVVGINDHYTVEGHPEFRAACEALGLRATFGIEAVALDAACAERGERLNDPGNPGRTYFSGKGVTRPLKDGGPGSRDLATMRRALEDRNRAMTVRINEVLHRAGVRVRIEFDDVLALAPHGNTTERHVCQALALALAKACPARTDLVAALKRLGMPDPESLLSSDAAFQNGLRAALVKAGQPAYVEESPAAFVSMKRMRALFLEYGAVPTYPILGNPVTEFEEEPAALFDRLEGWGVHAVEVIPHRNTPERLADLGGEAERRGFPVSNGTEHNTKTPMPMIDDLSAGPTFRPVFLRGARVLLGHQCLAARGGLGFVDNGGNPTLQSRAVAARFFGCLGRVAWGPEDLRRTAEWPSSRVVTLAAALVLVLREDPDGPDIPSSGLISRDAGFESALDGNPIDPRAGIPATLPGELTPFLGHLGG